MSMLTVSQKILHEEWDMLLGDTDIGQLTEALISASIMQCHVPPFTVSYCGVQSLPLACAGFVL